MNSKILEYRKYVRDFILDILSNNVSPKPGIHILNGHFLSLNPNAESRIFDSLLRELKKKGVRFIDFQEATLRIVNHDFPRTECFVAFTWDDGFEECFTKIKPVLDTWGIKAAFFINPNFIDGDETYRERFRNEVVVTPKNPMGWEMVKQLAAEGHTIGAHTLDHLALNSNDINFLKYQVEGSKERIETQLGIPANHFAFPYGRLKHISPLGVKIACETFPYVYSQDDYQHYFSFNGKVINRRHFECDWPVNHVAYFLKAKSV